MIFDKSRCDVVRYRLEFSHVLRGETLRTRSQASTRHTISSFRSKEIFRVEVESLGMKRLSYEHVEGQIGRKNISVAHRLSRQDQRQCSGSTLTIARSSVARIPVFEHKYDFFCYVHDKIGSGSTIDFLEFGVYKGHSIQFWSQMNRDPQSRFIGFQFV